MVVHFYLPTQPLVALQELHKHQLELLRQLQSYLLSQTRQEAILQREQLHLQHVLPANRVPIQQLLVVPRVLSSVGCKQVHVHHPTTGTKLYRLAVVFLKQSTGALMALAQPRVKLTHSAQEVLQLFVRLATTQRLDGIFAGLFHQTTKFLVLLQPQARQQSVLLLLLFGRRILASL